MAGDPRPAGGGRRGAGAGEQRFLGGGRDGAAGCGVAAVPAALRAARHAGGPGPGHAGGEALALPPPLRRAWHAGGPGNGSAFGERVGGDRAAAGRPYRGGPLDGAAGAGAEGFANPLDRDTDGDGLPDWWELPHFGWITNGVPGGNTDRDPADEWSEFVADTDPGDPGSYFRGTAFERAAAWTLSFTCSPARVYSVEVAADVRTGAWLGVEGFPALPGEADGDMSVTLTNDASRAFYRVKVGFPPAAEGPGD